jgi:hypothetical protein
MITITCRCGAIELEFKAERDLFRLECCCYDCSAALSYARKRGGPEFAQHQCVDSSWLPNDFTITCGQGKLGAFRNYLKGVTTRFYCTDCWSILFADHPAYAQRLLVTQVVNFTAFEAIDKGALMAARARHFLKDLSTLQVAQLPPWRGEPAHVYSGVAGNLIAEFPAIQAAGSEGLAMNAQVLLAKIGAVFIPTGEPRLTSGPPSHAQQAEDLASSSD